MHSGTKNEDLCRNVYYAGSKYKTKGNYSMLTKQKEIIQCSQNN